MAEKVSLRSYLDVQEFAENEWNVVLVTNAIIKKRDGSTEVKLERCHPCCNMPFFTREAAIAHVPFYARRLNIKPLGGQ